MMFVMARRKKKGKKLAAPQLSIPSQTKQGIIVVVLILIGAILALAGFNIAGPEGSDIYSLFHYLLGLGYFLLPTLFFLLAANAMRKESAGFTFLKAFVGAVFVASGLGFIALVSPLNGGLVGTLIANPLVQFFDIYVSLLILGGLSLISLLILLEGGISAAMFAPLGRAATFPLRRLLSRNG